MEENLKSNLIGQRDIRLEKLNQLKKLGVNPYPAKSHKEYQNKEVLDNFDKYEGKEVCLAGRITHERAWEINIGDIEIKPRYSGNDKDNELEKIRKGF